MKHLVWERVQKTTLCRCQDSVAVDFTIIFDPSWWPWDLFAWLLETGLTLSDFGLVQATRPARANLGGGWVPSKHLSILRAQRL